MTVNVDEKKYGNLLMSVLPSVITNDEELDRMTQEIDRLITKDIKQGSLSPEEDKLLELLTLLVEDYEDEHYPIEDSPPHEVLKFIMEQRDLKQSDLLDIFGSSGIASEVVNGKRSISKTQAKKLAERFKVSVELFI
ncbi:MAG: transcriptional regulator [Blastocatellia bacterium]|nr:transcriptional regulator [Blastocatellia bacterium]